MREAPNRIEMWGAVAVSIAGSFAAAIFLGLHQDSLRAESVSSRAKANHAIFLNLKALTHKDGIPFVAEDGSVEK